MRAPLIASALGVLCLGAALVVVAGVGEAQETPHAQPSTVMPQGAVIKSEPAKADAPPAPTASAPASALAPPQADEDDAAELSNTTATASEPLKRPRYGAAILQAVDKVTAQTLRFEARLGQPVRYKGLVITVNACETTARDEEGFDSAAHLNVLSQPEGLTTAPAREAFKGWMFAGAPAVHPFQHPVYDLWVIACKADAPSQDAGRS